MANALNRHEHCRPTRSPPPSCGVTPSAAGARFASSWPKWAARVVGYASFLPGYNTDIARPELRMLDLFVQAPWRSHGIGRALVVSVARETIRRGLACLEWGVRGDNRRAQKFYRSLGARVGNARVAGLLGRALTALAAPR